MTFLVKERVRLLTKRRTHAVSSIGNVTMCGKTLKRKWLLNVSYSGDGVNCRYCLGQGQVKKS